MGYFSGTPEIHCNAIYFRDKQPFERISIDGIKSILFIQSELTIIEVPFSFPPFSSTSSLPPYSEVSKVYV